MIKKRLEHIDFLRAVAIIGVIAIHTLSYQLSNPTYYLFWNYLNFVVVSFVYCSGYVLTARYKEKFQTNFNVVAWLHKRLLHLLLPFYIYLIIHYVLWLIFPSFFSGLGLQKSFIFIVRSVFLVGGIDLNWLPLLFLQLTLLFPFLMKALQRKKILYTYIAFSILITLFFTVTPFPYKYFRSVMWISWSVIILLSIRIFMQEHIETQTRLSINRYYAVAIISAGLFATLMLIHQLYGKSFQLVDFKYPPGFYYILYGLSWSFFLLIIGELTVHRFKWIKETSIFISKNSYTLFFVHYIMLDFIIKLTKHTIFWSHPFIQFICVLSLSLTICAGISKLLNIRKIKI